MLKAKSTSRTVAMADANRPLVNGGVVAVGEQGMYLCSGFWEVFQTPNSTWKSGSSYLSNWNLWHDDPRGPYSIPERTIAVEIMCNNVLLDTDTGFAAGDYGSYMIESYWDKAGTLLADRISKGYRKPTSGRFMVNNAFHIFCPITGFGSDGEGSQANEVPQITLRLTRSPSNQTNWLFGDFEVQRLYLPSNDNNFADKT